MPVEKVATNPIFNSNAQKNSNIQSKSSSSVAVGQRNKIFKNTIPNTVSSPSFSLLNLGNAQSKIHGQKNKIYKYESDREDSHQRLDALISPRKDPFLKVEESVNLKVMSDGEGYKPININQLRGESRPWNELKRKTSSGSSDYEGSNLQKVVMRFLNRRYNLHGEFEHVFLSLVKKANNSKQVASEIFHLRNEIGEVNGRFSQLLLLLWKDPDTDAVFLEYLKLLFSRDDPQDLMRCKEELDALRKSEPFQKQALELIKVLHQGKSFYTGFFAFAALKEKIESFLRFEENKMFKEQMIELIGIINDPKKVAAELVNIRKQIVIDKMSVNDKPLRFNKILFILWRKKSAVDVFLQYLDHPENKESFEVFQKSKFFQEHSEKLIKRMANSERKVAEAQQSGTAFTQVFAQPWLEKLIAKILDKKRSHIQELDSELLGLITTVKDPKWVADELVRVRVVKGLSPKKLHKLYKVLFLLWENRSTTNVVHQFLHLVPKENYKDYDGLISCHEFQKAPLKFIKLLAQCEIPFMREGCQIKPFALYFLEQQMENLYKELAAFIPANEKITPEQAEQFLNKIYYVNHSDIRILPKNIVLLLETIRMRFSLNEKYGDSEGLMQVSQLLFFSSIMPYFSSTPEKASKLGSLQLLTTEFTNRLRGNASENLINQVSPFRPLLDKFESVHRKFMDRNSDFALAYLEEKSQQDPEAEQDSVDIDD